ncbi:MAG: WD40 repeat domain-containing protein [Anaerolineae bacterium]|nr:WD40 repeat domain-containing protein [Anaerolineae bacterium]
MRQMITLATVEQLEQRPQPMPIGRGCILDATWLPDGEHIVVGAAQGIWFYRADALAHPVRRIPVPDQSVFALEATRDGKNLVFAAGRNWTEEGDIVIWDLAADREVARLKAHRDHVFAISRDSTRLAYIAPGEDLHGNLVLWDIAAHQTLFTVPRARLVAAVSPDNRYVVTGEFQPQDEQREHVLKVLDGSSGQHLHTLRSYDHPPLVEGNLPSFSDAAFDAAGTQLIAGHESGCLYVWELPSWELVYIADKGLMGGGPVWINMAEADDLATVIAVDESPTYTVQIRELVNFTIKAKLPDTYTASALFAVLSPDSQRVVMNDGGGGIWLWNVAEGRIEAEVGGTDYKTAHARGIKHIAFSPDGDYLVIVNGLYKLDIWHVPSVTIRCSLGYGQWAKRVAFSPMSEHLVAGGNPEIDIWNLRTGQQDMSLMTQTGLKCSADYSPDGRLFATASWDGVVDVWDAATFERRYQVRHGGMAWDVAFSPDGHLLASAGSSGRDGQGSSSICLWDSATGERLHMIEGLVPSLNTQILFNADGSLLASIPGDRAVQEIEQEAILIDVGDGTLRARLKGHSAPISDIAFSPTAPILATTGQDHSVRLWDTASGEQRVACEMPNDPFATPPGAFPVSIGCIAFNPAGDLLAGGGNDGDVYLWRADTGALLKRLHGGAQSSMKGITGLAFNPAGTLLAGALWDGIVCLWQVREA